MCHVVAVIGRVENALGAQVLCVAVHLQGLSQLQHHVANELSVQEEVIDEEAGAVTQSDEQHCRTVENIQAAQVDKVRQQQEKESDT